jgi:hypothetical protein
MMKSRLDDGELPTKSMTLQGGHDVELRGAQTDSQ